ncbi:hypothetical protein [Clostridium sp. AF32-12BH]|uniref:hypothetical protein n=1 Tax=Clostridium sp. AF32-12BH TaxID=2292006 RepID=UPI000E4BB6F5|nr:hypothetical protein [Clostridium sp. AF32-12BH]RHP45335.1 hypothetical protein DWZ40_13060 [Clostridium sp. AF32-12BH]
MYGIYVYKASIARRLVKMGYRIIDLKPGRTIHGDLNFSSTIFVFKDEHHLQETINTLIKSEEK